MRVGGCLLISGNRVFHWMLAVLCRTTGSVTFATRLASTRLSHLLRLAMEENGGCQCFFHCGIPGQCKPQHVWELSFFLQGLCTPSFSCFFATSTRKGHLFFQSSPCLVYRGEKLLRGLRSDALYPDYLSRVGSTLATYEIK